MFAPATPVLMTSAASPPVVLRTALRAPAEVPATPTIPRPEGSRNLAPGIALRSRQASVLKPCGRFDIVSDGLAEIVRRPRPASPASLDKSRAISRAVRKGHPRMAHAGRPKIKKSFTLQEFEPAFSDKKVTKGAARAGHRPSKVEERPEMPQR